jgi:hypothetical protein
MLAKLFRSVEGPQYNNYVALTKEELKTFSDEYLKFFKKNPEEESIIHNQVQNGELTPEEAYEQLFPS